jgi:hypothetical protein
MFWQWAENVDPLTRRCACNNIDVASWHMEQRRPHRQNHPGATTANPVRPNVAISKGSFTALQYTGRFARVATGSTQIKRILQMKNFPVKH